MAIYGAQVIKSGVNGVNYQSDAIGKNSEAIASGDLLTLASGLVAVAGATSVIIGVAAKTLTYAADNQTVAKLAPLYIPVNSDLIFLMGTNADLTGNATDAGTYYKLAGTTGAMLVDVTSGATATTDRIVEIVEVDPNHKGGTGAGSGLRECLVRIIKTPYNNIAISA